METIESLSRRIGVVEDLASVVRTMKALSAVSVRQYETAAAAIADYHTTIALGLQVVLRETGGVKAPISGIAGPIGVVLFGSDHGLCGRFNDQIVDLALSHLNRIGARPRDSRWLVLGRRAMERLATRGVDCTDRFGLPSSADGLADTASTVIVELDRWQHRDGIEQIFVFNNQREAMNRPAPALTQLLPLDEHYFEHLARRRWNSKGLPTFNQATGNLLSALIRQHLFVAVFRAGAESMAAEHAARLAAMQSAERNIADELEIMRADHHRQRQNAITGEIQDIIAGYETLKSKRRKSGRPR